MSAQLSAAGHTATAGPEDADALIVNACSFIEESREEAVEFILDLIPYKKPRGKASFLIITGCLPQMIDSEIYDALPEVDTVLGTAEYDLIVNALEGLLDGSWPLRRLPSGVGGISHLHGLRIPADEQYAWLKIGEGCSNHCTYCTIPSIRGPLVSRPLEDVVNEAMFLAELGVNEIILVSQDTTRYGEDIWQRPSLEVLLRELDARLPARVWIRIMYFYADAITDGLIDVIASSPRILNYIDMPIQHASDKILKLMGRSEDKIMIKERIDKLKESLPGLILRTTVMVGFPGETEEDFAELLQFIGEVKFDRLGCFIFSPEDGTPAVRLKGKVDPQIAAVRYNEVMSLQKEIALEKNKARVGTVSEVIFSGYSEGDIFYRGRSYGEAPEVDPLVWVAATIPDLDLSKKHPVRIIDADYYSLVGVTEYEYSQ